MIKSLIYLSCWLMSAMTIFAQQTAQPVPAYGDNLRAGHFYPLRGIRIYTETYGKDCPLLLLHGNGGSMNAFSKNIPFLSKRYRVIAMDSRAQGKSIDTGDSLSCQR